MAARGRITIQDIAREANVSPAAVSMILRSRPDMSFSQDTVRRVRETADRLGYKRPAAVSAFERPTVAIFLPLITGGYYTFISQAITQQADRAGYDTIILETHRSAERELRLLHSLSRMGASGAIFTAPPINAQTAVELSRTLPTVIITNAHSDVALDSVTTDDFRVGELVASHLLELGHRRVAFVEINRQWQGIRISQRLVGAQNRFAQVADACLTVHSRPAPNTLQPGSFIETREIAREITTECLNDPSITAFICISDYCAYGVMDALAERGLRIPEDYSVCSCDNLFASNLPGVSLTTVDRHPVEIGVNSFDLLLKRMTDGGSLPLSRVTRVEYLSNLIVRGSSGAPRATHP